MIDPWGLILYQAAACSLLCAFVAGQKNRDAAAWFVLGLFAGVLALIAVAGLPVATPTSDSDGHRDPNRVSDMRWLGGVVGRLLGRRP